VTRLLLLGFAAAALAWGQAPATPPAEPPEEDVEFQTKEYSLNPLQSQKEFQTGEFYRKKGSFKAAALRFDESFKWDNGNSEALFMLGVVSEKAGDPKAARSAFERYLKSFPEGKRVRDVRRRLASP
jgi:outer membrane protein assembly factor BamD (BamD/ComL family)